MGKYDRRRLIYDPFRSSDDSFFGLKSRNVERIKTIKTKIFIKKTFELGLSINSKICAVQIMAKNK